MEESYSKSQIDREIIRLSWPIIIEQVLIMMVGIVSTILVSRLGKEQMAGVGMVNMLINFFQTIFAGLASGATIITARVTGESGIKNAKLVMIQSILMGLATGLIFTICGLALSDSILGAFFSSAEPVVMDIAERYYKIAFIGIPFMVLDMVIAGVLRGAGDTKTPMYVTVLVNIVNAILSVALIFGFSLWGATIPAMGVEGAAIAATAARIFGGFMRVGWLFWKRSKVHISYGDKLKIKPEIMKRIINVGIPSFLENAIMQGGFLLLQIILVSIGTLEMAAYQVGTNIQTMSFLPIMAFSMTTTTTVGQCLGRCEYDKAEVYACQNRRMAVIVGICTGILLFTFAEPLASLYSSDPEVIKASTIVVRGFALIEPFMGLEKVGAAVMRSAGDMRYVILTGVVALWSLRIVVAYLLTHFLGLGLYGVMVGIFLDFSTRALMYMVRMRSGKWKYLKI